jgi:hypothetical protein
VARPERKDVDYFPFYVKDGKTLYILESQFGCKGTGFFTNVLRLLCQSPDHHFQIKEESDKMMFFAKCKCDEESGKVMLEMMVKTGKINKSLYQKASVICSEDLLSSIEDAYSKRINNIITIGNIKALYGVTDNGNGVSDTGNPTEIEFAESNSSGNPQSKVKERKGNKRKESIAKYDYATHTWLNIPEETVALWIERFPALNIKQELNKMATWLDTHTKNKKTDFDKFIGNWLIRNQDSAKPQESGEKPLW